MIYYSESLRMSSTYFEGHT